MDRRIGIASIVPIFIALSLNACNGTTDNLPYGGRSPLAIAANSAAPMLVVAFQGASNSGILQEYAPGSTPTPIKQTTQHVANPTQTNGVAQLAFDGFGTIYVGDNGTVNEYSISNLSYLRTASKANGYGIAVAGNGTLYFTVDLSRQGYVAKIRPRTTAIYQRRTINGPLGVLTDARGNIYVNGNNGTEVDVYSAKSFSHIRTLKGVAAIGFDSAGNFWASSGRAAIVYSTKTWKSNRSLKLSGGAVALYSDAAGNSYLQTSGPYKGSGLPQRVTVYAPNSAKIIRTVSLGSYSLTPSIAVDQTGLIYAADDGANGDGSVDIYGASGKRVGQITVAGFKAVSVAVSP